MENEGFNDVQSLEDVKMTKTKVSPTPTPEEVEDEAGENSDRTSVSSTTIGDATTQKRASEVTKSKVLKASLATPPRLIRYFVERPKTWFCEWIIFTFSRFFSI